MAHFTFTYHQLVQQYRWLDGFLERGPDLKTFSDPPLPLLITGITGVAGYHALAFFQARYPGRVYGLRHPEAAHFDAPGLLDLRPERYREMRDLFDRYRFASVLNCAGNCALKTCQLNPELAWTLNVEIVRNLLKQTRKLGLRLVHLSVDLVYGGRTGGDYAEEDRPDPVTVYGRTMVEGEKAVQEEDPDAPILRISLPMGISFNGHAGAVDWIASRFAASRPATLYFDEVRTPTYSECMNRVFLEMLTSEHRGRFHAGGPRRLSLFQIAQIINRVGNFDPDLLFGMPRHHAGPIPPRAGNVTMDSRKLADALGYEPFDPWPFSSRWVPTDRRWHYDRPADEERSIVQLYTNVAAHPVLSRTAASLFC